MGGIYKTESGEIVELDCLMSEERAFQAYLNWRTIPPLIRGKGPETFNKSGYNISELLDLSKIQTTEDFKKRYAVTDEILFEWDDRIDRDNLLEKNRLKIKRELTGNVDFSRYRNLMDKPTAANYKSWYEVVEGKEDTAARPRAMFNDLLKMVDNRIVEVVDKTARIIFEGVKTGTTRTEGYWNTDLPVIRKSARIVGGRRVPIDDPAAYPDLIYFPDMDESKTVEVYDLGREFTSEIIVRDRKVDLKTSTDTALRCDSCYARSHCSEFRKSAACAYDFSMVIESPGQLQNAFLHIINREVERLNRAFFFEKLDGGSLNRTVSNEVEKFARLVATVKYLGTPLKDGDEDEISLRAKGKSAQSMINKLFGGLASQPEPLRENPITEVTPNKPSAS